ncbi:YktB family protein [Salinicoccus roseus]|uniref:YktB family protein n=1 Tax=Salinicoccus roseus TaxID=45670 RepID=UPI001585AE34|nr:DUF1054 domain-containing protein [Salinicoccus roseus]
MSKYHFTKDDFKVFEIDGLEPRMDALKTTIRPKLENLGEYFSEYLTEITGDEHFAHVAKHARRKVNPPDDTWVSFSTNPRGYKMMPHFQIGLFRDHAFCMYGTIYESPEKAATAERLLDQIDIIRSIPEDYVVSLNHMRPEKTALRDMSEEDLESALVRLRDVKKGEFLVGKKYLPSNSVLSHDDIFIKELETVLQELVRLY